MTELLGFSIPTTITDDDGNTLAALAVAVTGPNGYDDTALTDAVSGVLLLGPLPVGTYTITHGGRSVDVPVLPQWPGEGEVGQTLVLTAEGGFEFADAGPGGGGGAPTGAAGGVLGGTYPHPTFAVDMATQAELNAEAVLRQAADDALSLTLATKETPAGAQAKVDAASTTDRARGNHTGTQTSTTISDFTEAVQDAVAALLGAGTNITVNYDDAANTLTIATTAADAEAVRDAIGVALVGVGNISIGVNDALDTITISTTATVNSTDAALRDRSTHTGTQLAATISDLGSAALASTGDFDAAGAAAAAQAAAITAAKGLPLGITGATQPTRYVGRWSATGAPVTGTFAVGDFGFDGQGDLQVCTVAGTPGTWRMHGTGTYLTVVEHGATAGTARPVGATQVLWVGSVEPTNAVENDQYLDPSAPSLSVHDGSAFVALGGGGGGAAPGPSGLMIAQARTTNPAEQVVAADSEDEIIVFTGGTILQGDDVWGSPGTALNLALTFGLDGRVVYPSEDAVYDLSVFVALTPDVADAGKPIHVTLARWFDGSTQELRVPSSGAQMAFGFSAMDLVFAGDTNAFFRLKITTLGLTQPVTIDTVAATVVLRG